MVENTIGNPTTAKLLVDGRTFYGVSGHMDSKRKIALTPNIITRSHAEAHVFQKMKDAGLSPKRGIMIVDRKLCDPCDKSRGVRTLMEQTGMERLRVYFIDHEAGNVGQLDIEARTGAQR